MRKGELIEEISSQYARCALLPVDTWRHAWIL